MAEYKLSEIVNDVIAYYGAIADEGDDKDALRHKIMDVCKRIMDDGGQSLWDATLRKGPEHKKGIHVFTEYQRQKLFSDIDFQKYIALKSNNKDIIAEVEEAVRMNKEESQPTTPEEYYQKTMAELIRGEDRSYLIDREFPDKKLALMVEALYSLFFEPLDEKRLYTDMEAVAAITAVDPTRKHNVASLRAAKRLRDYTNYCKRKEVAPQDTEVS